ncbi:MAG: glycogen/starch/alpha-glucan phosphorylase, partial [Chloroflexota bacterium]|nr:glycogen/starch/alpha-glucan phosphorylase [Chloroflexota bacterium]
MPHAVGSSAFSAGEPDRYHGSADALVERGPFMVAVDFDGHCRQQAEVDALWREPAHWWRAAVM